MTRRYQLDPKKPPVLTEEQMRRLDTMPIDYSDIPELGDEFLTKATVPWPPVKKQLTIRLDADVLDWLKGQGRGYQTRANRILRVAMESQLAAARKAKAGATHPRRKPSPASKTRSSAR